MKTALTLLDIFLLVAVVHASDLYDEKGRDLHSSDGRASGRGGSVRGHGRHGGHGHHGFSPEPTVELSCGTNVDTCSPRGHRGGTVTVDGGIRVCIQHPKHTNRNTTKCMEPNDEGVVMVFSQHDECGCCGGSCPEACKTCPCNGMSWDGEKFSGFEMLLPRHRHHWWGGTSTNVCVPVDDTIDKQLWDGTCVTDCTLTEIHTAR